MCKPLQYLVANNDDHIWLRLISMTSFSHLCPQRCLNSVHLFPLVFCSSKLENKTRNEDEEILKKDSHPGVDPILLILFVNDVNLEKYPCSSNDASKCQQETNKEPDPSPCLTQAPLCVWITSNLTVGHCINKEERYSGDDGNSYVPQLECGWCWN